jgi:hypothetical protein
MMVVPGSAFRVHRLKTADPQMGMIKSHLKKRILVQGRGGREVQTGGILQYFEDLNRAPHEEIGPKDFFETASILICEMHYS